MSAGAQAYLAKPCELQELRQTIRCLMPGPGPGAGALLLARTERACEWRRAKQRRGGKQAAAFITMGIERKHSMIQETPQADLFKQQMRESLRLETPIRAPSRLRNTITFTRVETVMRWSTSSRAGRSNCSCSRPKGESACWPSTPREIFSASCACPG